MIACLGLAGLLVPCLGLVQQQQPAAEGGRLLLLDQAKARQARQAQARPSQGKAQQASQPSQSMILGLAHGPLGPQGTQIRPGWVVSIFKNLPKIGIWAFLGPKMVKKKVEIEGAGTP